MYVQGGTLIQYLSIYLSIYLYIYLSIYNTMGEIQLIFSVLIKHMTSFSIFRGWLHGVL